MSTSRELALAYVRERYPARRFVPLAILLAVGGMIAAGSRFDSPMALLQSALVSYLLVLAFRVWDDIEDRERDRREHPERLLVRSPSAAPWWRLIALAFAVSAGIIAIGPQVGLRLGLLALGVALLFAWYRARRVMSASPLIGMSVIFAKYPLIAYVAAPPSQSVSPLVTVLSLLALYAVLCSYELVDDPVLRGSIP